MLEPAPGRVVRLSLRTTAEHAGQRLDDVLASWLPAALGTPLSKAAVRQLVIAGAIDVGGRPLRRPAHVLAAGLALTARVRPDRLRTARAGNVRTAADRPFALTEASVLHEDDALIAIDKPPGLPTVPTADASRPSLFALLTAFRGGYIGVHQRLDRDTSGVVLFTKDPAANPPLAEAFARHTVAKTYYAITGRPRSLPPPRWRAESRLATVGKGRRARVSSVGRGGALARTDFQLLETFGQGLLVEARPETGRKHQIRVHLAEAGLAILGDDLYGEPSSGGSPSGLRVPRLMLHARRLRLRHPLTGVELVIESPPPEDFRRALAGLRPGVSGGRSRTRRR